MGGSLSTTGLLRIAMNDYTTSPSVEALPPLASSGVMRNLMALVEQIAPSNLSVLIVGEKGTGKEWTAQAIHRLSPRAYHKLIRVDCMNTPIEKLANEIFGAEKATLSGVDVRHGAIEQAENGTLFLDEIGELPLAIQKQIARVIGDQQFRRVGSQQSTHCDVRVIAALSRSIKGADEESLLPREIHHHISPIIVNLSPLREHREDIPYLIDRFLLELNRPDSKHVTGVSPEALRFCLSYDWPGNIRQLKDAVRYAMAKSQDHLLQNDHLQFFISKGQPDGTSGVYPPSGIPLPYNVERAAGESTPGQSEKRKGSIR
jgi:two-component system response regulator HydG